ncbi:MAG: hypothetical protein ACPGN3_17625 [Opitutales bacterium]
MDIEFSHDELKSLVKALRIADWISNSRAVDEIETDPHLFPLQQKIYKAAADAGLKDVVCYDFGSGDYEEHPEFDISIFEDIIDLYDEAAFWNGLVDRLVIRAMEETYGAGIRNEIEKDPEHRIEERDKMAELLRTVMERDGIYALNLQPGWSMPDGLMKDPDGDSFDPRLN